jgi:predicted P-loop ATPase
MENLEIIEPEAVELSAAVEPENKPSSIDKVEQYLNPRYDFRYNVVTGKVECKPINHSLFNPMTDYVLNSLTREMTKVGINSGTTMVRNLLISDYTPVYNPYISYLNEIEQHDGVTDYIQQLAETVTTTNDPFWHFCFPRWLVAMVGSLLQNDVVNHTVIVLSGGQGVGKTTWLLNLVPEKLKEYCYSGAINPNNKDTLVQLSECMLINLDELENLNRTELSAMKELITKSTIRLRRPYGFTSETLPRRASFCGSVNGKEFLNDVTGNRRLLCFEVKDINYSKTIPMDKVFAQALALFNSGFQYWFSPSEVVAINKSNEEFRSMTVEEELLLGYFESCDVADADLFYSTTEIINWFSKNSKIILSDASRLKMGKALRAHKFLRIKRQARYVYALKLRDPELAGYLTHFSPKTDLIEIADTQKTNNYE